MKPNHTDFLIQRVLVIDNEIIFTIKIDNKDCKFPKTKQELKFVEDDNDDSE